jgi:hypothetical protein
MDARRVVRQAQMGRWAETVAARRLLRLQRSLLLTRSNLNPVPFHWKLPVGQTAATGAFAADLAPSIVVGGVLGLPEPYLGAPPYSPSRPVPPPPQCLTSPTSLQVLPPLPPLPAGPFARLSSAAARQAGFAALLTELDWELADGEATVDERERDVLRLGQARLDQANSGRSLLLGGGIDDAARSSERSSGVSGSDDDSGGFSVW